MEEKNTRTFELPSGSKIDFQIVDRSLEKTGQLAGPEDVSKGKSAGPIPIDKILEPLSEVTQLLFEKIKSTSKRPNSITLELGASINGQMNLVIVSGEGQASIKVTLTWKND